MPQFARPDADLVDGNWVKSTGGNVDLFSMVDEASFDDADYIESGLAPSSDACALRLSDVEDPQSSSSHVVRWRHGKDVAGGAQIDLTVQLRQGYVNESTQGTLIAGVTRANLTGGSWTADSFTLSGAEADAITDYTDLAIRLVASQV